MANRFSHLIPQQATDGQQKPANRFAHLIPKKATGQPQTVDASGKGDMVAGAGEVAPSTYAADIGRSMLSGLRTGAETVLGTAGDMQQLSGDVAAKLAEKVGVSPDAARKVGRFIAIPGLPVPLPSTEQVQGITKEVAGKPYETQTMVGKYARQVGEFAPNVALGPGGVVRKTAMTVIPAIASEAAGQLAEGSEYEPVVRAGTAIAATIATGGKGNSTKQITKLAPTAESVKQKTDDLYQTLREAGITYDANAFDNMAVTLQQKLVSEGFRAAQSPLSADALKMVGEYVGKGLDYNDMESVRKVVSEITRTKTATPTDRKAATMILKALDKFTERAPLATNGKVAPTTVNTLQKKARELAQRNIMARKVDDMVAAAQDYQSGVQSGLQNQFGNYLRSFEGRQLKKTMPEVWKAFHEVSKGGISRNLLTALGRAGIDPTNSGGVAALIPLIAGGATYYGTDGDWAKTLGATAVATGAKFGAKRMTVKAAENAKKVVLAGRKAQGSVGATVKARDAATVGTAAVSGNQSRAGEGKVPWPDGAFLQDAKGRFYDRNGRLLPAQ